MAANHEARALFGLSPEDLGRTLQDLDLDYYKPLRELRSQIERAYAGRRPFRPDGDRVANRRRRGPLHRRSGRARAGGKRRPSGREPHVRRRDSLPRRAGGTRTFEAGAGDGVRGAPVVRTRSSRPPTRSSSRRTRSSRPPTRSSSRRTRSSRPSTRSSSRRTRSCTRSTRNSASASGSSPRPPPFRRPSWRTYPPG